MAHIYYDLQKAVDEFVEIAIDLHHGILERNRGTGM